VHRRRYQESNEVVPLIVPSSTLSNVIVILTMIKKARIAIVGEDTPSRGALMPIISYMGGGQTKEDLLRRIQEEEVMIREYAEQAKMSLAYKKQREKQKQDAEEALTKLPDTNVVEANATRVLERLARLPWVDAVLPNSPQAGWIAVRAKKNSLLCTFYNHYVRIQGGYYLEALDKPVKIPYPQYSIAVNVTALKSVLVGANTMSKNGSLLMMVTTQTDFYSSDMVEGRKQHKPDTHFASRSSGWSDMCLGEYAKEIEDAFKRDIVEGFEAYAAYLQSTGSKHAWRPRAAWALDLGYAPFNKIIVRDGKEGETRETIEAAYKEADRAGKLTIV
jgi:hypothetical protein